MSDNNRIWDQVSHTPPSVTKTGNERDGRRVTSYPGQYVIQKLTEVFGPIGKNWGYDVVQEREDDHGIITEFHQKFPEVPIEAVPHKITHTIKINMWWKDEGSDIRNQVGYQFGHTPYRYWSRKNGYLIVDEEAPKKSLTDALKKSASLLGVAADIFMGEFDDREYVAGLMEQERIEKADNKSEEEIQIRKEFRVEFDRTLNTLSNSVSLHEAKALQLVMQKKIEARAGSHLINTDAYQKQLDDTYAGVLARLNGEKKDD